MSRKNRIVTYACISLLAAVVIFTAVYFSGGDIGSRFLEKDPAQSGGTSTTATAEDTSASNSTSASSEESSSGQDSQDETIANSSTEASSTVPDDMDSYIGDGDYRRDPEAFKDIKAKAVYINGDTAANKTKMERIINMVNETELNALVIDIKEGGRVHYKSNVPEVVKNNAYVSLYDPVQLTKWLHENNIYVIARLVVFRDDFLARKRPELAIKRPDGTLWKEGKVAWTNPYKEEVWRYNLDIAREAIEKGFDEIQFDYVRFPTAKKGEIYYGENMPSRSDTICGFLKQATEELRDNMGAAVSADVFGIICEVAPERDAIGQILEYVGKDVDCISPMLYPSHFANKSHGTMGNGVGQAVNGVLFTIPDLKPYEVIYNSLVRCKSRISQVEGYKATVRPYLQGFTATYLPEGYYQTYGPEQLRQQIQAVYDAGYEQWIIWNSGNVYNAASFLKEPAE